MVTDMAGDVEMYDAGDMRKALGELSLRYYGPALDEDHSMSAKVLAPALLSFSDAIEAAKDEIYPDSRVELRVKATEVGSFDIQFVLQNIGTFSQTNEGQAIEWLVAVGGVGIVTIIIGAVKLVAWLHAHGESKVVDKTTVPDDDSTIFSENRVTIEAADGTRIQSYESCLRIAGNRKFVNSMGKALSGPASQEGIDGAEISSGGESADVDKETARSMSEWVPAEEIIDETDSQMTVQPLDAHFEPGKKWHVTAGGEAKYTVDMLDQDFIREVEEGKRIGKKDIFQVNIHSLSYRGKDGKLKAKYSITKVIKHTPYIPPEQGELDFN